MVDGYTQKTLCASPTVQFQQETNTGSSMPRRVCRARNSALLRTVVSSKNAFYPYIAKTKYGPLFHTLPAITHTVSHTRHYEFLFIFHSLFIHKKSEKFIGLFEPLLPSIAYVLSFLMTSRCSFMNYRFVFVLRRSLTLFALLVVLSACTDTPEEGQGNTFYYNDADGVSTLDPAQMSYRAAIWAGSQLYNGLVQLDTSLHIVPALAHSWEVDSTGTQWTFHLRRDVYFHTDSCFGSAQTRPVQAADVKYSIERVGNAQTASRGLWVFSGKLLGFDEHYEATKAGTPSNGIRGIAVLNDSTVQFTLVKPFAPFLSLLTMPYAYIVPHEAVEKYGKDFFRHPVGTGPFRLAQWQPELHLVLERNPNYWERDAEGKQLPYLQRVSVSFARDARTEFLEFKQGKLDFISSVDPSIASTVFTAEGTLTPEYAQYHLLQAAAHSIDYYGILLDSTKQAAQTLPLATSKKLRQALNYAIDREKIVRYVLKGKGIPAHNGVLPPSMPGFSNSVQGYSYNPQKARQLLAEAGFPNGKNLPPLALYLGMNERTAAVAEAVQQQWKELGISLDIRPMDFPQLLQMVSKSELAFWRTSWIGDYPGPENFLALFYSPNSAPHGPNTTHSVRRDLDSLYEAALSPRLSDAERYALYNQMETIILGEAPWVFLYYNIQQRLAQPWVEGFPLDGADRLILKTVRKRQH